MNRREFVGRAALAAAWDESSIAKALGVTSLDSEAGGVSVPSGRKLGTEAEMAMAEDWARSFPFPITGAGSKAKTTLFPDVLKSPLSFSYGEKKSADLLPKWKLETTTADPDGARREQEAIYTDPATGLEVRIAATIFRDFPAVEWVMYFRNAGGADTPILENIQPLEARLNCAEGDPTIHYAKGSTCSMDDFMPLTRVLGQNGRLQIAPRGGRSSSQFLPFFNLEARGEGVVIAIGWSGEWAATYSRPEAGSSFQIEAGMALTHLKLLPGEEIRTPRILTLFWQGDARRGNNLLRQFILTHHRPTLGGKHFAVPITNHNWGETPAADHLENIRQIIAHDLPLDYYWIDAGWAGQGLPWWRSSGNWEVNKNLYPQGFKPISDLLHSSGRKFLLWFEPERVCAGTPWLEVPSNKKVYRGFDGKGDGDVPVSDPRWIPDESARNQIQENDKLFNLGIPEARVFLTDFLSAKIDEFGLDCYRHDENIAPLEFWRAADAPDRQGITEIRWVEGLYAYWDELLRRHPNLIIDGVSSGSRFLDLETMSRSLTFTRSDFVLRSSADQCHSYGLLQWVPLNATSTGNLSLHNEYRIRSSMTSGLEYALFYAGDVPQHTYNPQDIPFVEIKRSIEQYLQIQKYFYGDYYPLTEYTQAADAWVAYQFDLPEEREGLVVVLKRPESKYTQAVFRLAALKADADYAVTNLDTHESGVIAGRQLLAKGLETRLSNQPDSAVFRYARKA